MIIEQSQSDMLVQKISPTRTTENGSLKTVRVEHAVRSPFAEDITLVFAPGCHHLFYWLIERPHQRFTVKFSKVGLHNSNGKAMLALYVEDILIPITMLESVWQDAEELDARNRDDDGSGTPF